MSDDPSEPGRPTRICDGCGQSDTHPREQHTERGGRVLLFHYDCVPFHIASESPSPAHEAARKGVRGDDLIAVIEKHAAQQAKES